MHRCGSFARVVNAARIHLGRDTMKKIRLELEQLAVESFATARGRGAEKGTVRGHDSGSDAYTCEQDCTWGCTSHTGLDVGCICQPQANTDHHSCSC
jgi:hypothetical protein